MAEIEVQNKINFRNIIILFVIGVIGVINGLRDFNLFKLDISKILFPDPVTYHNVVELNNSMMSTMALQNSMSFASLGILVIVVIILSTVIFSFAGIMGGRGA
jgi:hypothetical protein